jgi:hypothetical protein
MGAGLSAGGFGIGAGVAGVGVRGVGRVNPRTGVRLRLAPASELAAAGWKLSTPSGPVARHA